MSQDTTVQTKKEFLKMLSDSIEEDAIFLWTQNVNGIELKKKLNEKRVTLGFAADAFDRRDGVGDLIKNKLIGLVICKRELLSEGAKSLVPLKRTKNEPSKKQRR